MLGGASHSIVSIPDREHQGHGMGNWKPVAYTGLSEINVRYIHSYASRWPDLATSPPFASLAVALHQIHHQHIIHSTAWCHSPSPDNPSFENCRKSLARTSKAPVT